MKNITQNNTNIIFHKIIFTNSLKLLQLESINLVTDEYIQQIIDDFQIMKKQKQETIKQRERNHCKQFFECFNNDIVAFENVWKKEFIAKFKPKFANELNDIHIV